MGASSGRTVTVPGDVVRSACGVAASEASGTHDRHYGHLARDGREHALRLLDTLHAAELERWTLVDAAWTPKAAAVALREATTGR